MLDVVLVALATFAAKSSGLATAFTKAGLRFFAASAVLLRLLIFSRGMSLRPTKTGSLRAGSLVDEGNQCLYCWIRVVRRPARPYSSIDACQDKNSSTVSL
jgi:hypothetical protein